VIVNGSNCNQWQFNRLQTKGWSNKRGTQERTCQVESLFLF
jgi:hypothetical protein